jgi:diacylglycerol kinase (ATP)
MEEDTRKPGRKPVIILNSNANSGRSGSLSATIRGLLKELDSEAEIVETGSADEGRQAIQAAATQGEGPVVVCGGDGTIRSAASSLLDMGSKVPLGIVPLGTGNDYAFGTLGLPSDMSEALKIALRGRPRAIDVARANDEWVTNIFAAGLAGNVAWDVQDSLAAKRRWARGSARYTISILRQIMLYYNRLPLLEITIDGKPWGKRKLLNFAATIGPTTGGGYKFAPEADPYDGRLDVVLMHEMSRFKALRALPTTKTGGHVSLKEVEIVRAQEVTVRCDKPIQAHIDGDPVRDLSYNIRVMPGALTVMTPP